MILPLPAHPNSALDQYTIYQLAWKPSSDILISISMTNHPTNNLIYLQQETCI